ncbi:MAG: LysR family transcriptional regulator [Pseudomonadota bacterium]|jgi:DNA-binding transcriptional LysR family regulator|uniref:DNA-binding transcriptional LysR family regulator n=1 Tax=Brevundimonas aurantiaca TaxID=74316 RepID=A0A7W9C5B0_9CAUL|nr:MULTISPECIES: LysR family transcriptional regulator [Brevundimonas]MEC7797232.1 LysR family transcriptional regulator [Pseudomonadota bacterium]MBB5739344.1 DNA-binding transcriptional LysR family regulator [Brevundimonas aurantiaca]MBJ7509866.1 LysR family transcriptional regulator [Brevundimonas sp.]MCC4295171.1 LysR family transcriptional regulator [Brevundimonas aurantiaca]MEC8457082.1 LysR family transcriptional regulator [Pseudomonadota bacterium]
MQTTGVDRAREMEVFAAVAQSGSFSAAGRMLDLTPSAVSRTIDRIEARLGVRLMLRTTRVLTLTAEGQTYLAAARRILADLDDAERVISDQGAPRGRVRVSASLAHGRQRVVPLLGEFARLYPHILIDFNLTDVVVDVAAGQADVAIRFGPLADSPLTARRLGETGRTIVASPEYLARRGAPQVPEDLHDHDCLNFNFRRAEPVWPFRRDGRDYALTVRGPIEANNGETLTQLALAGVGVTRVGNFSVADAIETGRLVPLLEAFNPGDREPIHAVFVGGANMPARVRVFVDFLAERLR